jgi:hypothetical protein
VKFDIEMQVTDLKIYFGQLELGQYKITVTIFQPDKVVYMNTFDENTFAHFSHLTYSKQASNQASDPENDALHISHLDL